MQQIGINQIVFLQFDLLKDKKLFHFVTTRSGGISEGNYASLNLGNLSDDVPAHVYENRKRLAEAIGVLPSNLFIPHQTHSDHIRIIDKRFLSLSVQDKENDLKDVDALITDQPDIAIGVTTADCVPVLLFDPGKNVLAAVHAGWKGTVLQVAAKTVKTMRQNFDCNPRHILAGIGPSISPEKFEVGDEVGEAFIQAGFKLSAISFRNHETKKLHINLWQANRLSLLNAGLLPSHIEIAGWCSYCDPQRFFSARRQTVHSGRMLTGGMIKK